MGLGLEVGGGRRNLPEGGRRERELAGGREEGEGTCRRLSD